MAYREMLANNAKAGDVIILLLSLDDAQRVPEQFADLMPSPWPEIESRLKQGQTVLTQTQARDMTVFLLAAPTVEKLRTELRRHAAAKEFSPDAGKKTE